MFRTGKSISVRKLIQQLAQKLCFVLANELAADSIYYWQTAIESAPVVITAFSNWEQCANFVSNRQLNWQLATGS